MSVSSATTSSTIVPAMSIAASPVQPSVAVTVTPSATGVSNTERKYSHIFSKFNETNGVLHLGEPTKGIAKSTLIKVMEQAEALFSDPAVRAKGKLETIDKDEFIFKLDCEANCKSNDERDHLKIFRLTKFEELGKGSAGIVKKVLLITEAKFVVFKEAELELSNPYETASEKYLRELENAKRIEGIKTEYKMSNLLNAKGPYKGFPKH